MPKTLTDYEVDILRCYNGEFDLPGGAAFNAASETLSEMGYLTKMPYQLSNAGVLYLKSLRKSDKPINRIERGDVDWFRDCRDNKFHQNNIDVYQRIATKSAIYPGQGTPFGLMYAALGLAEAGEVQNKVKKAFRDDGVIYIGTPFESADGVSTLRSVTFKELPPERKAQIIKELGGALWYIAAVCNEIGATMSEVALQNLEELCSRGERGTLSGDGDNR